MLVGTEKRKTRNSTKVNLIISAVFHSLIVGTLLYFAAREGLLGKKIKTIAVEMVQKEKPKEPPKPKEPEKPKIEPPKVEEEKKLAAAPKAEPPKEVAAPPPSVEAPPTVAPPVSEAPTFDFDGGKTVISTSDPIQLYKGMLENALRLDWDRPKDVDDHSNVAEVEITVDKKGEITSPVWKKHSGQKAWDDSVNVAIANTPKMIEPPPSNFPSHVVVRFDVQALVPVGQ